MKRHNHASCSVRATPPPLPLDVLRQRAKSESTHPGLKPRPRLSTPPPLPLDALNSSGPQGVPVDEVNRRTSSRRPIRVPVDLVPVAAPNRSIELGSTRHGKSIDLSEEGLLLAHSDFLPLGSVVRVFVRLPDRPKPPMATDAKVVRWEWRGEAGYGLKFIDPDPSDVRRIQRLTWH